MRVLACRSGGRAVLGVRLSDDRIVDLSRAAPKLPRDLRSLLAGGPDALAAAGDAARKAGAHAVIEGEIDYLPPIAEPSKIICVGLNYVDHAAESPYDVPDYPVLFARFPNTLVAHGKPMIRPLASDNFDYEGEMVAIIGRAGRHVPKDEALEHVAGYSIFNEGSVRDFQFKSSQWTMGKNFDATGGFGPELVTADELPEGATGLRLETRLNGEVMQRADTKDMVFGVAELVHVASEAMTLAPGDVIVTGTPGGVGFARDPKIFMKDGDTCEVEIEGIGLLRNPIRDEVLPA
jgi:2-keto-4-pentenoate hydratase/2-oxohepta-3-ene-1,7-dioic acid hydratase in catechol pathway